MWLGSCAEYLFAERWKEARTGVADTTRHIIKCDFSVIPKDSVRKGHVLLMPYTITNDTYSAIYKMSPYGNISQSNLLVHKNSRNISVKIFNILLNMWMQEEFYPYDVQFLTKGEYKADMMKLK